VQYVVSPSSLLIATLLPVAPTASTDAAGVEGSGNPFLVGLWMFLGLLIIWSCCYWGLYPWLLKYYSFDASKAIFWPTFLLFAVSWLHLGAYTLTDYAFYHSWVRTTSLPLASVCSLWFLFSFARRYH